MPVMADVQMNVDMVVIRLEDASGARGEGFCN